MIRSHSLGVLAAVAMCLALANSAPAQQEFRWKFQEGESLELTISQEVHSTASVQGQQIDTAMNFEIGLHWEVESTNDDGSATITQSYERMKMSMDTPLGQVEFDSENEEEPQGMAAAVAAQIDPLLAMTIELTVNPRGEVVDIKVPEEDVEALQGAANSPLSEESIKQLLAQSLIVFPEEAISVGDEWERQIELAAGMMQMEVDAYYTYEGEEEHDGREVSVFSLSSTVEIEQPEAGEGGPIFEISNQEGKGHVWFDQEAGRVVESGMTQSFDMDVTVQGQSVTSSMEMNSRIEITPTEE